MKNWPKEIQEERARIWAKYGFKQDPSLKVWRHKFAKQLGDMTIIVENGSDKKKFRKEVIQIAALAEECLNQLQ